MKKNTNPYFLFSLISILFTLSFFSYLVFSFNIGYLFSYLLAINCTTFLFYAYDKRAALSKWKRVPEIVLHGLALLGGTPFAFLGQYLFRHKTIKGSFRIVFWLIFIIQIILLLLEIFAAK